MTAAGTGTMISEEGTYGIPMDEQEWIFYDKNDLALQNPIEHPYVRIICHPEPHPTVDPTDAPTVVPTFVPTGNISLY